MKSKPDQFFSDLAAVRRELERWRRTRQRKGRIPEALWRTITPLGRRYGVSRVARDLRVPFFALRDRVEVARATEATDTQKARQFVEVPLSLTPTPTECVVELEDASGWKMTLRLTPANAGDAAALIQTLRGRQP